MRAGIQEETLRALLEAGAVREVLVSRFWTNGKLCADPESRFVPHAPRSLH